MQSYGIYIDDESRIWLILEYMDMNLKSVMDKLKESDKLKVAISVAKAMRFLHHEFPQKIIHRDLKPENILVTNYYPVIK